MEVKEGLCVLQALLWTVWTQTVLCNGLYFHLLWLDSYSVGKTANMTVLAKLIGPE